MFLFLLSWTIALSPWMTFNTPQKHHPALLFKVSITHSIFYTDFSFTFNIIYLFLYLCFSARMFVFSHLSFCQAAKTKNLVSFKKIERIFWLSRLQFLLFQSVWETETSERGMENLFINETGENVHLWCFARNQNKLCR